MATVDQIMSLQPAYERLLSFQREDGVVVWRFRGNGIDMQVAEDDSAMLQSLVNTHSERVQQENETSEQTTERLLTTAVKTQRANRDALVAKLVTVRDTFRTNYTNWPSMSNAQKDAANRNAQRALANLIQMALDQFDDQGI